LSIRAVGEADQLAHIPGGLDRFGWPSIRPPPGVRPSAWRPCEGRESIAGPTIAQHEHAVGALGDSSHKDSSPITALAAVRAKTAYLVGELCGVAEDRLPNFAETQAATEGARGAPVFYAFNLLHLDGRDTVVLPLCRTEGAA
jgi:hypothetical protein